MAFDASVLSQIPDYAPNVVKAQSEGLNLADMMNQNQMGKLKLSEERQSQAEYAKAKEILGKSDLSTFEGQTRAAQDLTKISPKLGMDFMAKVQSGRSAENQNTIEKLQIADQQQDALVGALDPIVAQLSDLKAKGKEPAIIDAQAKNLVIPALLRLRQARPDLQGVIDKFQQDPQNLTYAGILSADQQSKRGSQAIKDRIAQMNAETAAGRANETSREDRAKDADRARKAELGNFTDQEKDLLAELAARNVTLPAGFRSKEQIKATLQGLFRRYEGLPVSDIADGIRSGKISLAADTAAARTAGGIVGKVHVGSNELVDLLPAARQASHAVDRGKWVPFNKVEQMIQAGQSDPDLQELYNYTQAVLNAYDVVAARGGTDKEKRAHNREMLTTATSQQAYDRALDVIMRESKIAEAAAGRAIKELSGADPGSARKPSSTPAASGSAAAPPPGKPGAAGAGTPPARPGQGPPVKITGDADYNQLPSGATYIDPDGVTRTKR
jgi:hypothetical protein